jgi:cytochrome c biogenesis protein CcmG, thiol:disulfide interchange protein DsbE
MIRYLAPLGGFLALAVLLWVGLGLNPRELPSPLIGKPAPHFDLPDLYQPQTRVSPADLRGEVWMLNVWASWCVSCRHEHPLLVELARGAGVRIVGLNYKDGRDEALGYLRHGGNPYRAIGYDREGAAGIEWGVYGTPETFIIDRKGIIRHKHVGPLHREVIESKILPLLRTLEAESA